MVYDDLVRQGKLRYVALSNHPAWQVTQALWIADDRHLAAAPVCATDSRIEETERQLGLLRTAAFAHFVVRVESLGASFHLTT